MKDLFKKSQQDQELYTEILTQMGVQAISLGADPDRISVYNAWQKCDKAIRAYKEAEQAVIDLGYSSLPIAIKALGQFKNKDKDLDLSALPEVFHNVPYVWVNGRKETKKRPGLAPMGLRAAQRQHRVMVPLLLEAWELTGGDVDVQREIEYEYRVTGAAEFERALYNYIHELEEPTLEDEFADLQIASAAEFEEWCERNAEARRKQKGR